MKLARRLNDNFFMYQQVLIILESKQPIIDSRLSFSRTRDAGINLGT